MIYSFAAAARLPACICITIGSTAADRVQMLLKFHEALTINGIMLPFAFLARRDQTALCQNLHMVGKRRLSYLKLVKQIAATLLSGSQHLNNTESVYI